MFSLLKKSVPVVMQMESLECGAASLAMILAYFGKWVPLEEVRISCGVSRDGSNLKDVAEAGMGYGLVPTAYKSDVEGLSTIDLPAIIHWNFNHFVVLCKISKNYAIINDPAQGRVKVSIKELDESFTGVVMCFSKGENFSPSGHRKSVLSFARSRLSGAMEPIFFILISFILATLVDVVVPVINRLFFNRVLVPVGAKSATLVSWLAPLFTIMVAVVLFKFFVALIINIYNLKVGARFAISSSSSLMWHILRLPMEFFSQRSAGDICERQVSNEIIAATLVKRVAPLVLDFFMIIVYFLVLLKISVILTAIGVVSCIINIFFSVYVSKKRINFSRLQMKDEGKLSSCTVSGIGMIETIKAAGAENGFFEKWAGLYSSVNKTRVKTDKLNQYFGVLPEIVDGFSTIAISLVGAYLMISKEHFTLGLLMQFQAVLMKFIGPVASVRTVGQEIQETRSLMERIDDVMDYKPDVFYDKVEKTSDEEYKKLSGNVEIKNLTFGYKKLGAPLIKDFNLTLKPGMKVALVGPSGCGKSTIAKLVSGLYKPWFGDIFFDGKSIDEIKREVFTASLAVVDQDICMFEDTISENIKMWDSSIENFEVILAARDADIHSDIVGREGGYDAIVRENGKNFSGGQRQRIEIARTLAQDPTIIVLDEATSALDAETEYRVVKAIADRGITCIIVAHRLSTIRDCDEIIVLEKGKIVQRGKHEELYAVEGFYKKLISVE